MAGPLKIDSAGNVWDYSSGTPVFVRHEGDTGGQSFVMPAPPKAPPEPKFVPEHPNLVYHPDTNTTTPIPGVPAAPQKPTPVEGRPGFVLGGTPDKPTAIPISGLPPETGKTLDPSVRAQALKDYAFSQQLNGVIANLRQKYAAGPGATKGIMGAKDYLPLTANKDFDTAADAARGIIGQALGFTGSQLNTEHESEMNIGPFLPHSGDRDQVIESKLQYLQDLADQGHKRAIMTLGGTPDANGNVVPSAPPASPDPSQFTLNGGAHTRAEVDPVLQAVGQRVGHMLVAGTPDAKIIDFLQKSGIDPTNTNIRQALQFRGTKDFQTWTKANPGKAYPLGPDFYTKQVPVTPTRAMFNAAAASGPGGAMLAAPVAAANAISGDRLASLSGDPMAQTGMQLLRSQHPVSSLVGDVAGQASDEALLGRIPGAQSLMAGRWGRRGTDLLYGGYYGSGDDSNGDGLTGGLEGAVTNTLGGMFGRGAQKGVGRTLSGVKNQALQYLDNLQVPLTIGQIGRGSDNMLGHVVGGIEDRLAGLPGFDAVIGEARRRGNIGFNQAAFKEVGGSGATGAQGLAEVNGIKNNAYSFLNGTNLPIDAQFAGRNAGVRAAIPGMPAFGNEVGTSLDTINDVSANGFLPGQDWQSAISDIRGDKASIAGQPFYRKASNGLGEIEDNLLGLADRQGPPGTIDNLNNANRINAQVNTLAAALDKGPVQRNGQMFSPQHLDDASRVNTRKFGGRMASLTGQNRPFYQLSQAGLDVMPNLTPDSGTAGRLAMIPLISGLGGGVGALAGGKDDRGEGAEMGAGYGALLGAAAMGPYSKAGQKIIQKALLGDRPSSVVRIGDYLISKPKLAGMFGSGAARDYFLNQYLPQ